MLVSSYSHQLLLVLRDEIAGCSEKAYDYLTIDDAQRVLLFNSRKELLKYVEEVKHHFTYFDLISFRLLMAFIKKYIETRK